ncbi:Endopolyphosphatase [Cladobotryum mycophilum]|uniref:Endopolyphosphatase n=1 Tax=Cladobotryum mycophilum TaxID=491253 RepID=A0ABR0S6E4_9HYPO
MPRAGGVRLQHRLVLGLAVLASAVPVFALPLSTEPDSQKVLQLPLDADLQPQAQRKLQGRFLHISDFHPDEFYKVHTSTEEGIACHRGTGLAGTYGAEKTDCDTPYTLVNATFKWIEENIRDSVDFVIWTGDSARHDSDEQTPRHEPEVVRSNRFIANKFVDTFSTDDQLSVPIIPTFGNNDFLPHNVMYAGPNKWLQHYTDIWHRFIPEEQRHSFGFGGWFSVEVIPNQLAVFSLNTMYFFDRNPGVDGCAHPDEPGYKQLDWLRVQLQIIRDRGMKAILMGHVPPARTESKQLWDETCWQKYTLWLKQYRDVVTGSLYGHMNLDHFLLQDVEDLEPSLGAEQVTTRDFLEDELWVESKEDYLQELREKWSDLPKSIVHTSDGGDQDIQNGKKNRGKKHKNKWGEIGGEHAERYQLTLISPSVVPNYFPTLRIVEYNITGLEGAAIWKDPYDASSASLESIKDNEIFEDEEHDLTELKKKKEKSKPGRKPPKDHDLISLSLTGYTQYFANLTHINDDIPDEVEGTKWRQGEHDDKTPKHGKPKPRKFKFEVEYSTFHDKIYKMADLTVKSYLQLAYRMKSKDDGKSMGPFSDDLIEDEEQEDALDAANGDINSDLLDQEEAEENASEDLDALKKKHKKKKNKNGRENNKTWLYFLSRAFVSTVPMNELKQM